MTHPFLPLIAETLHSTGAKTVIRVGDLPWPQTAPVVAQELDTDHILHATIQQPRQDLLLMSLAETNTARDARQLIAAGRDLLARQMLVFVPEKLLDGILDDNALLALGLCRQAQYEIETADGKNKQGWQAWSYDIRSYKSVPDWLNPKFWANPENWGKYRW
jgi:hypothetical protein